MRDLFCKQKGQRSARVQTVGDYRRSNLQQQSNPATL
jgi:hypothetical protein